MIWVIERLEGNHWILVPEYPYFKDNLKEIAETTAEELNRKHRLEWIKNNFQNPFNVIALAGDAEKGAEELIKSMLSTMEPDQGIDLSKAADLLETALNKYRCTGIREFKGK